MIAFILLYSKWKKSCSLYSNFFVFKTKLFSLCFSFKLFSILSFFTPQLISLQFFFPHDNLLVGTFCLLFELFALFVLFIVFVVFKLLLISSWVLKSFLKAVIILKSSFLVKFWIIFDFISKPNSFTVSW